MATARSLMPGGEMAGFMAERNRHPRLVMGGEGAHAIAQVPRHQLGILRKPLCRVPIGPSSMLFLQRRRQIPVIQRGEGLNVAFEQAINQPVVEIQATAVDGAVTGRLDPGPGD